MKLTRKRRWIRGMVVTAIVVFAVWNYWPLAGHITIGYDTTRITGPVNSDDTVNYAAYLNDKYGRGVTPENNAAALLLEAFGPSYLGTESLRQKQLEMLGLQSLPSNKALFRDFIPAKASQSATGPVQTHPDAGELLSELGRKPWSAVDHPDVAKWLTDNATSLDLIVQASHRPRYFWPLVSRDTPPVLVGCGVKVISYTLVAQKALAARSILALGKGEIASARSDVMAMHRLARLMGHGMTMVEQLVALAMENVACRASTALATDSPMAGKDAREFLRDLQGLGPMPDPFDAIDQYERYAFLDGAMLLARSSDPSKALGSLESAEEKLGKDSSPNGTMDWDRMLRRINDMFDLYLAAQRDKATAGQKEQYRQEMARLEHLKGNRTSMVKGIVAGAGGRLARPLRTQLITDVLITIMMPAFGSITTEHLAAEERSDLARVAAALAVYRAEHGGYPISLDDVKAILGGSVPPDRFGGKALVYKPGGGGYELYSVGPNSNDDGGKEERDGADDLVVRCRAGD